MASLLSCQWWLSHFALRSCHQHSPMSSPSGEGFCFISVLREPYQSAASGTAGFPSWLHIISGAVDTSWVYLIVKPPPLVNICCVLWSLCSGLQPTLDVPSPDAVDKSRRMTDGLERLSSHPDILATPGIAITPREHTREQTPGNIQKPDCKVDLKTEKQGKETDSPRPDRYILKLQEFLNNLAWI